MNRVIKFRGKEPLTDIWLYGDLLQYANGEMAICEPFSQYGSEATNICNRSKVLQSTVGQFTGLTDRSGTEIYEGDIITVKGNYPRVVLWDKASWALMPCEYFYDKHFWVMNLQHPGNDWWEEFADEMKVVGNMYDNPELLKPNSNATTL